MLPRNPLQRRPLLNLRTQDARHPLTGIFLADKKFLEKNLQIKFSFGIILLLAISEVEMESRFSSVGRAAHS